eukprot:1278145-Amphidinium_carterae.1
MGNVHLRRKFLYFSRAFFLPSFWVACGGWFKVGSWQDVAPMRKKWHDLATTGFDIAAATSLRQLGEAASVTTILTPASPKLPPKNK